MSEGAYFGEIGVLVTKKRTWSIFSKTASVFFAIEGKDLIDVLKDYPIHMKFFKGVAKQSLQTTKAEDLNDDDTEFNREA